jgi:hypothetical protein
MKRWGASRSAIYGLAYLADYREFSSPDKRRRDIAQVMIAQALSHTFEAHCVDRVDLGVCVTQQLGSIRLLRLGSTPVGRWPDAVMVGQQMIDVVWMTIKRNLCLHSHEVKD